MGCLKCGNIEIGVVPHGIRRRALGPLHREARSTAASLVEHVNRSTGGESNRGGGAWEDESFAETPAEQLPLAHRIADRWWPLADVDPSRATESDLVAR